MKKNLVPVFAIWEHKDKNNNVYYTGRFGDARLVGFTNYKKKNPKEPDVRFYVDAEPKDEKPVQREPGDDSEEAPF
jgi:hypothetical protein